MSDLVELESHGHRWWVDPAHEAFVRETLAPVAASPESLPGAEVVKSNRVRTVVRADGPAGKLFVKRFRVLKASARWLHTVKPSPARREWNGMRGFAEAGIPCPKPVILGEERRSGLLRGSVFATLEVPDAVDLPTELDRCRDEGDAGGRRAIAEALARAVWKAFEIGANHPDMHSGNFLIGADGELVALDMHSLLWIRGGLLGVGLRRRRLAKIAHSLRPHLEVGREEVRWLAEAYAQLDPDMGSADAIDRMLLDRSRQLEAVRLASRGKRCLKESTSFAVETVGSRRIYRRREVPQAAVLAALEAPTEHVLHAHPKGRSRLDVIAAPEGVEGGRLIRKNYLFPGLRRRFAGMVNPAPLRYWKAARACELRGVNTPQAYAMVLEGGALPSYGGVLLELIEDATMIHVLLQREPPPSPASRRRLAVDLGRFMGQFHGSGLEHHDLAVQNILIRPGDGDDGSGGWEIWIIDLDEVSVATMTRKAKLRALTQLGDLPEQATRTDRARFWRAYLEAGGERVMAEELEDWGPLRIGQRVGELLAEKAARKAKRMARKRQQPKPTDLGPLSAGCNETVT